MDIESSVTSGRLRRLPDTFATRNARAVGIAPRELYRLRDSGVLHELSRGVFRKASAPAGHPDLLAVAVRAPSAVVCLESSLALHELIDDIPWSTHIAIPRTSRPPKFDYPPVTVHRFNPATFDLGVEMFEAAPGEHVPIYSAARSVVDAMRLRHIVGDVLAFHALRVSLELGAARPGELVDLARVLGVEGPVLRAMEVALS
jgi:predicted transcriptional regulator of viral defense system